MSDHDLTTRRLQADSLLAIGRVRRAMERRLEVLFAEAGLVEITPPQSNVLMVLFQARGPMNARHVARHLGVSDVTVGRFVKALERADWVQRERDPEDSRSWLLRPTQRASSRFKDFARVFDLLQDEVFAGFSRAELDTVADLVTRVHNNLEDRV